MDGVQLKRRPRTERPSCSIGLRNQGSAAPHGWRRGTENDGTEHAFAAPRTVQRNLRIGNQYLAVCRTLGHRLSMALFAGGFGVGLRWGWFLPDRGGLLVLRRIAAWAG